MNEEDDQTTALTLPGGFLPPDVARAEFERVQEHVRDILANAKSENTRRNYQAAWTRFETWCTLRGYTPVPVDPAVLVTYATLALEEGVPNSNGTPGKPLALPSLWVHLSAIIYAHRAQGHPSPLDQVGSDFMDGLRRKYARAPQKKRWISLGQLNEAASALPRNKKGVRDRAILLVAFASGGRRRAEIAAMRFEELTRTDDGWLWTLPRTKTGTEPFEVAIPQLRGDPITCPARTLDEWIRLAEVTAGPVFGAVDRHDRIKYRTDREGQRQGITPSVVADIVKAAVTKLGLDPQLYGAHSLRSGFITDMARKDLRIEAIMERTGHRSVQTALGYIQSAKRMTRGDPVIRALETEEER